MDSTFAKALHLCIRKQDEKRFPKKAWKQAEQRDRKSKDNKNKILKTNFHNYLLYLGCRKKCSFKRNILFFIQIQTKKRLINV